MDFTTLTFTFPRPLTQAEEDMLIEATQAIAKAAKNRMKDSAQKLRVGSIVNKGIGMHADRFETTANNFNHFFRLTKPQPSIYTIMIAGKLFEWMDIKIGHMTIASYQDQLLKRTESFIFKCPIKDMGFQKDQVRVERGTAQTD